MSVMTMDWVRVGKLVDIPRQGSRRVKAGSMTIAVFRTADDRIFALEDKCPHKQGPLSQGIVHGDCVTCPLHNWVIALDTGEACGADEGRVVRFPVRLDGNDIFLSFPSDGSQEGR